MFWLIINLFKETFSQNASLYATSICQKLKATKEQKLKL